MSCCTEQIHHFANEAVSYIAVNAAVQATSGNLPLVVLAYSVEDGRFAFGGVFSSLQVELIAGLPYLVIDHGFSASGFVKLR
jgi:hypothetical protein